MVSNNYYIYDYADDILKLPWGFPPSVFSLQEWGSRGLWRLCAPEPDWLGREIQMEMGHEKR